MKSQAEIEKHFKVVRRFVEVYCRKHHVKRRRLDWLVRYFLSNRSEATAQKVISSK